ncbi:uncharacterized protein K452DRAFT_306935 [Aplosporella prunicola CBS 121167]|uniref:Uncharacterized protein n=1 Tax=Aplosporella prunicola CBS 121167 TaxID=1176127 RepID=A0A6A6BHB9_9PEZI|nr:uncharacterized protein K452DRAFT_306935 [Aplosporella prunicola CBS 121167]KAF2143530.1 hypothetical protein K452DRAFT_306935 [Aplosporella prunicola CBS 121167]
MTGCGPSYPQMSLRYYGEHDWYLALFVLVEIPHEEIDKIIEDVNFIMEEQGTWLATEGAEIPTKQNPCLTKTPIDRRWTSPYLGKAPSDAAQFLKSIGPHEGFERRHFLVVDDDFIHEKRGLIKMYRMEGEDYEEAGSELTVIAGKPSPLMNFAHAYRPGQWEERAEYWKYLGQAFE